MKRSAISALCVSLLLVSACAGSNIFSAAPTSVAAGSVVMPSPVSVKASAVTGNIYVVNSDGKVKYTTGSFAELAMDATNPAAPVVSANKIVSMTQFGGDMALDAQFAYVTNRKSAEDSAFETDDTLFKVQIDDGSLTTVAQTTVGPNPFGITLSAGELFIVSDLQVDRLASADLSSAAQVDLSGLSGVNTTHIEGAAIDTVNGWLAVTNRNGDLLIIDTTDNSLDYEVEGPNNTRGIAIGNSKLYVLEGTPPSLLVLDLSGLAKQTSVALIDDSSVLVGTVALGDDPCQIALDLANSRAYVSNTGSDDISVIDTDLLSEIGRISLDQNDIAAGLSDGREPCGIDVGTFNAQNFVIVANYDSDNLSIINAASLQVVATFP